MFTQPVPQSHEYITRPVTINPVPGRTIAQTELIIEISPKFDLFTLILILVIYYTSHDSSAVVWCAILWPDCISTFLVTSAPFRRSRIWAHKLFAKWSSADNTIKTTVDIQRAFDQMAACHDDVIKWKYFPRYWPFVREIHRSPVNFPHNGQWHGALMFTLICARKNGWINNGEAGDLRRYLAHYDVIVMLSPQITTHKIFKSSRPSDTCMRQ